MAYTRTNWNNTTPITPDALNNIEQGLVDVMNMCSRLETLLNGFSKQFIQSGAGYFDAEDATGTIGKLSCVVTYPKAFSTAPQQFITLLTSAPQYYTVGLIASSSKTDFTAYLGYNGAKPSGKIWFTWFAIGEK